MPNWLTGFPWWDSEAHLLLLSQFIKPRRASDILLSEGWEAALDESPQDALNRFLKEKLLVRVDLAEHIARTHTIDELKRMLDARDMLATGDKRDMIAALLRADPEGMKAAAAGEVVLRTTQRGQSIAEHYLEEQATRQQELQEQVREALNDGRFKQAAQLVVDFEKKQVFPGDAGPDVAPQTFWQYHDAARDGMILRRIMGCELPALQSVDTEAAAQLRIAACMMYLWGSDSIELWLPDRFSADTDEPYTTIGEHLIACGLRHMSPDGMPYVGSETTGRLTRLDIVKRMAAARTSGETPEFVQFDLRGLDLGGISLNGANLRRADLRHADLRGTHLVGADLSHANLQDASLRFANLTDADLYGANLTRADLSGAVLHNVDLSEAVLADTTLDESSNE